jgi:hypothetical protein
MIYLKRLYLTVGWDNMGFFENLFKNNNITVVDNDITFSGDATDAIVKDPSLKYSKPKYVKGFVNKSFSNIIFEDSEYDLSTIDNAVQIDGILNRAVNTFTEQINKNGFDINIPNDKVFNHVMNRLKEIELGTNIATTEIIATISKQLVTYGNAYIIKVRKNNISKFGKPYELYNTTKNPIVGLFMAHASSIKIGLDNNNKVRYYKQVINGQEAIFKADDVIHLYYNRIPGLLTGRSPINQVLDDIRALRKLEEEAEILGFQYAVPLYLYKVGNDNHPAAPGEVDAVTMEVNHMNTYGIMCVPHTHSVETVTNNNDPIDIIKYIEHFKKRVYTGLGVSPVAMGESDTANRSTAESAYLTMQATTKTYQQIISEKLELELLKELIMDGGYSPQRFEYKLRFHEIDLESTIKKETHILQKYHANLITLTEARSEMDYEVDFENKELYMNQVQIPLIIADAKAKIKIQENAAKLNQQQQGPNEEDSTTVVKKSANGASVSTTTKHSGPAKTETGNKTTRSTEKQVVAKSRPENQHGKQLSRPTFKKDEIDGYESYINTLSDNLLNNNNYKSKINRDTFKIKVEEKLKHTILKVVDNIDSFENTMHTFSIRLNDKVNRLENIDSEVKADFVISSIIDEIISVRNSLEINDENE